MTAVRYTYHVVIIWKCNQLYGCIRGLRMGTAGQRSDLLDSADGQNNETYTRTVYIVSSGTATALTVTLDPRCPWWYCRVGSYIYSTHRNYQGLSWAGVGGWPAYSLSLNGLRLYPVDTMLIGWPRPGAPVRLSLIGPGLGPVHLILI